MKNAKEPVYSRSYGKEDMVKETQEGCLSRPIRKRARCKIEPEKNKSISWPERVG